MKPQWSFTAAASLVCAVIALAVFSQGDHQRAQAEHAKEAKTDNTLSTFMRKKLSAASDVLEGLATEDGKLIAKGGNAMAEMSRVEIWQVLTDGDYRNFSRDFRDAAKKLAEAGEKENFDSAALHWIKVTTACIDCHKYVRQQRAAKK